MCVSRKKWTKGKENHLENRPSRTSCVWSLKGARPAFWCRTCNPAKPHVPPQPDQLCQGSRASRPKQRHSELVLGLLDYPDFRFLRLGRNQAMMGKIISGSFSATRTREAFNTRLRQSRGEDRRGSRKPKKPTLSFSKDVYGWAGGSNAAWDALVYQ